MGPRPTASIMILGTDTNNALDPWMTFLVLCVAARHWAAMFIRLTLVVDHTSALFRQIRPLYFSHWG